jgi:tetratricopeptide (TPR) repeat protein
VRTTIGLIALLGATAAAAPPEAPKNLKYFPKGIARDALVQRMREFSFALGVRCQYCHAGGDGVSFEGVDFSSDEKPAKNKARTMLRMVDALNKDLAKLPARHKPAVKMECVICHRGLPVPMTLATELTEVIDGEGIAAAVKHYRELREKTLERGLFSFDQWTMNELARALAEGGKTDAAIAMLELNAEFYPKSADIDFALAELHRTRGERDKAIERFKAGLAKRPESPVAKQKLEELEKTP